jgi:hypothetical protein
MIGREDQDGSLHEHIIGLGWDSHLPADHSCNEQGFRNVYKFNIIFCDWGRRIKWSFYFPGDTLWRILGPLNKT